MSVKDFVKRHKEFPNSELLDGTNVHPMNVIDIPLDYVDVDGKKCGSVVTLPTDVLESSLGHKYQKYLKSSIPAHLVDLISAHHKYLLLSEAGALTEPHEDMTGSNVFYALLKGEKVFHVYYRDTEITNAIRTMLPEAFDSFLKNRKHAIVHLYAGQGMIMPGNLVHRVYTIVDSVAIGCNFISEPQMKNALLARQWEREMVDQESSKPVQLRELKESNLFFNFEAIAAIYIFECLQYHRLNIPANETEVRTLLIQLIYRMKKITHNTQQAATDFHAVISSLQQQWVKPFGSLFDWVAVDKFYKSGSFL